MKKLLTCTIVVLITMIAMYSPVYADLYPECRYGTMIIDHTLSNCSSERIVLDSAPYIKDGRAMVPIKFVEYSIEAEVTWLETEKSVQVKIDDHVVKLKIGDIYADVDGKKVVMDTAPEVVNNRTMVPLRFIGENLGARVSYSAEDQMIEISKFDIKNWTAYRDPVSGLGFSYPSDYNLSVNGAIVTLTTRCGNNLVIKRMNGDYETAASRKTYQLISQGWDVYSSIPMNDIYRFKGITMNADFGDDPRYYFDSYYFEAGGYTYSWEFSAVDDGKDMHVEDWIINDMVYDVKIVTP